MSYKPSSQRQSTGHRGKLGETAGRGGGLSTRAKARLVAAAVLLAVLLAFVLQNAQHVQVDFLFLHGRPPLWVALIVTAVIGGLIGRVVEFRFRRRRNTPNDRPSAGK